MGPGPSGVSWVIALSLSLSSWVSVVINGGQDEGYYVLAAGPRHQKPCNQSIRWIRGISQASEPREWRRKTRERWGEGVLWAQFCIDVTWHSGSVPISPENLRSFSVEEEKKLIRTCIYMGASEELSFFSCLSSLCCCSGIHSFIYLFFPSFIHLLIF